MLPPVDDAVLQSNPNFAALYSTLTTVVLNPDGSSKNDAAAKESATVKEELKRHRLQAAKQHLLAHAIATTTPTPPEARPALPVPALSRRAKSQPPAATRQDRNAADLPAPLLDLLLLLPPLLATPPPSLPPESVSLLLTSPPLSDFPSLLPQLAALVSSTLHTSAVHLARIVSPTTNPSFVHRTIPALPSHATSLAQAAAERTAAVTRARLAAATALTALLHKQADVLAQLVRALEAKHGPVARSLEFRAGEAALVAQRQAADAETALWTARRDTYSPDAARALANYAAHLRDARTRLAEAVRSRQGELEEYGVEGGDEAGPRPGKERTMREMARVYREMGKQADDVRGDLERLGRA
ncbi:hypothetical protein B0T26DRAFT_755675 [Lasiosphaeria miniovina]|uniref:Uncharacterized protein n=1 Tax=Lasiosphaeria miniovina TaxID=1954250 RepID=A0AA40DM00_9PEZI|nr:uncharacterized protein B0T26DRAFT_755675 [Lasiosphaeria miniovina]KAK0706146.1 hypothetical protein B0T26DRAFT_755675 [Lasiosphaeria miniovina]